MLDNICRYFRLSLHTKPINKEKKKECEHRTQLMSNPPKCKDCGMVMVVYNKPIIHPHMKPKRPSYKEAYKILKIVMEESYDPEIVLLKLGFVDGQE
jgi:predicted Zn-ribbon and HTH transcriptional regulator